MTAEGDFGETDNKQTTKNAENKQKDKE